MRPGQRFLAAGLAVAAAEAGVGLIMIGTVLAAYFLCCAAASAGLALLARRLFEPPPGDGGSPPGGDGGPDEPPPPWWPEFESGFRRYVRERERAPV